MNALEHSFPWIGAGLVLSAVLCVPSAVGAQASGVLQARVRVLDVRPAPAIPVEWLETVPATGTKPRLLDQAEQRARLELQSLPDSAPGATRRLRLTVTYLR